MRYSALFLLFLSSYPSVFHLCSLRRNLGVKRDFQECRRSNGDNSSSVSEKWERESESTNVCVRVFSFLVGCCFIFDRDLDVIFWGEGEGRRQDDSLFASVRRWWVHDSEGGASLIVISTWDVIFWEREGRKDSTSIYIQFLMVETKIRNLTWNVISRNKLAAINRLP